MQHYLEHFVPNRIFSITCVDVPTGVGDEGGGEGPLAFSIYLLQLFFVCVIVFSSLFPSFNQIIELIRLSAFILIHYLSILYDLSD